MCFARNSNYSQPRRSGSSTPPTGVDPNNITIDPAKKAASNSRKKSATMQLKRTMRNVNSGLSTGHMF